MAARRVWRQMGWLMQKTLEGHRGTKERGERNFHHFVEMSWLTLGVKTFRVR